MPPHLLLTATALGAAQGDEGRCHVKCIVRLTAAQVCHQALEHVCFQQQCTAECILEARQHRNGGACLIAHFLQRSNAWYSSRRVGNDVGCRAESKIQADGLKICCKSSTHLCGPSNKCSLWMVTFAWEQVRLNSNGEVKQGIE